MVRKTLGCGREQPECLGLPLPLTNLCQASENIHPGSESEEEEVGWNLSWLLKFRARPLNAAAEVSQPPGIGYGREML